MPRLSARSAGLTDTGRVRTNNEDAFAVAPPLYIVADGMGGAAAGEVASRLAVATITAELAGLPYASDGKIAEQALRVFRRADDEIKREMRIDPGLTGMGTTVVMAIQFGDRLFVGSVGDSRAYLVRGAPARQYTAGERSGAGSETGVIPAFDDEAAGPAGDSRLIRITEDHSVVMEMVASGVIGEEDIRTHPLRNRITRCLGSIGNSDPEFYWCGISEGDTLILCSDGLWEMIHDEILLAVVNSATGLDDLTRRLVDAANNSGGVDNITVIAVRFSADTD